MLNVGMGGATGLKGLNSGWQVSTWRLIPRVSRFFNLAFRFGDRVLPRRNGSPLFHPRQVATIFRRLFLMPTAVILVRPGPPPDPIAEAGMEVLAIRTFYK